MNYTYKQIWLINFPVMMSILMEQLINITDAIFLGHVGEVELGASALASVYYLAIYMLGFGFSLGLQVMIARRNGEQRYKETGKTFFQGLFFLSGLAVFLSLTSYVLSPVILKYFIHSPEIYKAAVDYLEWRCFGLLFSFPFLAFRAFFVGITKTRILSWAATLAVLINIPCNYLFIFSFDLGISGAAMASSLAEAGSLLILVIYVFLQMNKGNWGLRLVYDGKLLKSLFHLSVWSMMHAFISVAPWFLFFVAIERLGEVQLAVSNIIRSISTVFFVIVNSFAATTGSLVSNLIGAGEGKSMFRLCGKILRLGYALGFPLIIIAMLLNKQIVGFYTDNVALIELAYYPFIVMLLNYTFALPGYVFMNAVTGTGNTRIAFIFQISTIAVLPVSVEL
jgi:putative MATE family efflux protein